MTTFDSWEVAVRPPEDYLMHFRTKGSKNGVRRYQTESGEWTPLGLEERRKREGFGDSKEARKAAREVRRTERKLARADRQQARSERREERKQQRDEARAAFKEKQRLKNVSKLTDEELKAKIERVKMEQEYKELTKSPLLKTGEKIVSDLIKKKAESAERAYQEHLQKKQDERDKLAREHEMAKLKEQTEQTKLRAEADKARAGADKARAETDKIDIEKGTRMVKLKNENKSLKLQGKRFRSENTIFGGLRKRANTMLRADGEALADQTRAWGQSKAAMKRGLTDARIAKRQNKILTRRNRKLMPYEEKAQIRESGQNYWDNSSNQQNEKQKKKKGG